MNESDARGALLIRAYETAPPEQATGHWTAADAHWATQAALQVEGERASAEAFLARRARLATERIDARDRNASRVLRALTWRAWVGWAVALAAIIAGVVTDAIGPAQRINVLAPPLLAILAWNLIVYVLLALRAATRLVGVDSRKPGPFARQLARAAHAVATNRRIERLTPPLAGFVRDWTLASAPLTASRVARILHTAAAALAAGALLGMYMRGIALEYRAGWESTFFDAPAIHAFLAFVLEPASAITGIALPDVAELAAIRASASPGENAARWIHLYAMTIALFVLVPRGLLAFGHFLRERRLISRFPIPLRDAYFQSIARALRGESAQVHIVPYSFRPNPQGTLGLNALMTRVFGTQTGVSISPTVAFGDEDALDPAVVPDSPLALVAALFSLTATPERENHAVFLDELAKRVPSAAPLAVLIDESAFRQRFDTSGAAGAARRDERRAAWGRMLAEADREAVFVDLEEQEFNDAERALRGALDRALARAAQE